MRLFLKDNLVIGIADPKHPTESTQLSNDISIDMSNYTDAHTEFDLDAMRYFSMKVVGKLLVDMTEEEKDYCFRSGQLARCYEARIALPLVTNSMQFGLYLLG